MNALGLGCAIVGAMVCWCGQASACVGYDINMTQVGSTAYDPAAVAPSEVMIELRAQDAPLDETCADLAVEFEPDARGAFALRHGGHDLEVQRSNRQGLSYEQRRRLVRGETLRVTVFEAPPGDFAPPGLYAGEAELRVGSSHIARAALVLNVEPSIRLAQGSAAVTDIDFGELQSGEQRTVRFFFRSNVDVQVTATSDNSGRLVHERGESMGFISYGAHVNGEAIILDGLDAVTIRARRDGFQSGALTVRIGEMDHPIAGRYRDVLTLNFRPY